MFSVAKRAGQFRQRVAQEGVAAAVLAGVRVLLRPSLDFGSLVFFDCDLIAPLPDPAARGAFDLREADAADLPLLEHTPDAARRMGQAAERLARGDRWFVGLDRETGALATYRWVTMRGYIPEIDCDLIAGPGEIYIYDLFTVPAYRRRGADATIRHATYSRLRDDGVVRILAYISASNHASLRAARRMLRPLGRIRYIAPRGTPPIVFGIQALRNNAGVDLRRSSVRRAKARNARSSASQGA